MDENQYGVGPAAAETENERHVKLSSMRKAINKRLTESARTVVQSGGSYEVDVTELLSLRKQLVEREEELSVRITVTDLVSFALIRALKECDYMTAFITETEMIFHNYINLGVAVSVPNGLVTVVVRNAHQMSLLEFSRAAKELTGRAKSKRITMEDISDATFTMSSLGANSAGGVGIPLVTVPQAGIIQFGAALRKPVVVDEKIVIRSIMRINISYDHRIVDGAEISKFNQSLKKYVENPSWIICF